VLTGNQLAMLAGITAIPDETDVNEYKLTELAELFIELEDHPHDLERRLHERAATLLDKKDLTGAWKTLLAFNN
jgi:hypothetical protein